MSEHWSPGDAPQRFAETATRALDVLLEHDPVQATWLGDHRFDDRLPDWSGPAVRTHLADLGEAIGALDAIDDFVTRSRGVRVPRSAVAHIDVAVKEGQRLALFDELVHA